MRVPTPKAAEIAASRIEDIAKIARGRATGMNRWMEKCRICASKDRRAMNESILNGMIYPDFVKRWGDLASVNQYMRHRRWHLFDLLTDLVAVDTSNRMLRVVRFPMDGTGYEQADFVVRQLGYMLDQKRFGSTINEDGFDPTEAVRKDCMAILRAIVVRENMQRDVPTQGWASESDEEILRRAQEYANEQRAAEESESDADIRDVARSDDGAESAPDEPAETSLPAVSPEDPGGTESVQSEDADRQGSERYVDDVLGSEPGPPPGDVD
jgi:hypothetical protein